MLLRGCTVFDFRTVTKYQHHNFLKLQNFSVGKLEYHFTKHYIANLLVNIQIWNKSQITCVCFCDLKMDAILTSFAGTFQYYFWRENAFNAIATATVFPDTKLETILAYFKRNQI